MANLFTRLVRNRLPKVIDPDTHATLDYFTIGAFCLIASVLWDRNRRGAVGALVNAGFVLSYSMFTDYSGSLNRAISFPTHGKLDIVQGTMAAAMPTVLGFGDAPEAMLFRGQAMNEALVLSMTDFEAGGALTERRRRLASVA